MSPLKPNFLAVPQNWFICELIKSEYIAAANIASFSFSVYLYIKRNDDENETVCIVNLFYLICFVLELCVTDHEVGLKSAGTDSCIMVDMNWLIRFAFLFCAIFSPRPKSLKSVDFLFCNFISFLSIGFIPSICSLLVEFAKRVPAAVAAAMMSRKAITHQENQLFMMREFC